jgi:Thymidine kinase
MAGRLEIITGPMFAGKSEELMRRINRAKIANKSVVVFKPDIDTRYSTVEIVSHSGAKCSAIPIPPQILFGQLKGKYPKIKETNVVAFDEGQFFGSQFPEICERLVKEGKRVIVAGLDLNFRGEPFGPMPILLALADEVLKLTAICSVCGEPATRTQRLIGGKPASSKSPEVLIGGKETYEARCREHWIVPD